MQDAGPNIVNHFGNATAAARGLSFQGFVAGNAHINYHSTSSINIPNGVPEAGFDAAGKQHISSCLTDTRHDLLKQIRNWADSGNKKQLYWVKGMAGTGKTTIALTIAREYHRKQCLGATFFFSRGCGDLSSTHKFAATIAMQLAGLSLDLCKNIEAVASSNPYIHTLGLCDQWERLVIQPLSQMDRNAFSVPIIVVIDALDECDDTEAVPILIQCLRELISLDNVDFRVLITSRPDNAIKVDLDGTFGNAFHELVLHDILQSIIDHDLAIFYKHRLSEISQRFWIDENFLSDNIVQLFVKRSHGLFTHAATICQFVRDSGQLANERLSLMSVAATRPSEPERELDNMYATVLCHSFKNPGEIKEKEKLRQMFRRIMGSLILVFESMSPHDLSFMTNEPIGKILSLLENLNSVIDVQKHTNKSLIRPIHPSFGDFLLDPKRCLDERFSINAEEVHGELAGRCLRIMSDHLHRNMCKLSSPGDLAQDVPKTLVDSKIAFPVQYACQHWVHHLQRSSLDPRKLLGIRLFFQTKFLVWLESLALLGLIGDGISMMCRIDSMLAIKETVCQDTLSSCFTILNPKRGLENDGTPSLNLMVHDAKHFLLSHSAAIEKAPLQVYYSAMLFTPSTSITKRLYSQEIPSWILRGPILVENWSQCLQGFTSSQRAGTLAFSPDGELLASAAKSKIWLWDAKTGAKRHVLPGHTSPSARLEFSPNGKLLISRFMNDPTIRVWNPANGKLQYSIEEHDLAYICVGNPHGRVMFSPDGRFMAAPIIGHKIRLWDSITGEVFCSLSGHTCSVRELEFSPDSKLLASGADDKTVRIWDMSTGLARFVLQHTPGRVCAVKFSPDGRLLASGSDDKKVRLWDPSTGLVLSTLQGHSASIRVLAFTPNSDLLISIDWDGNVRLSDAITGEPRHVLQAFSLKHAISLSSKSLLLATVNDAAVQLLDITTGRVRYDLWGSTAEPEAIEFSPDGKLLASASIDGTVRVWKITPGGNDNTPKEVLSAMRVPKIPACFSDNSLLTSRPAWISEKKKFRAWGLRSYMQRSLPERIDTSDIPLAISPDGRLVASRFNGRGTQLWGVQNARQSPLPGSQSDGMPTLTFSHDSKTLASTVDESVWICNLAANPTRQIISNHHDYFKPSIHQPAIIDFSPDGNLIASGSGDDIKLYDFASEAETRILKGHSDELTAIAFSPDGKLLASGSGSGSIDLWGLSTGRRRILNNLSRWVGKVKFSPNGKLLVCGSGKSVRLLDVATNNLLGEMKTDVELKHVSFSSCGSYLLTDRGGLPLPGLSSLHVPLYVSQSWIRRGGKDILFIPPNWRDSVYFVSGDVVAFMTDSKKVMLLRFEAEGIEDDWVCL